MNYYSQKDILIIAGPTASGKSQLALEIVRSRQKGRATVDSISQGIKNNTIKKEKELEKPILKETVNAPSLIGFSSTDQNWDKRSVPNFTESIIINADSMQVYKDIPILSSQPSESDRAEIRHDLYSICEYNESMNAAKWAKLASDSIRQALHDGIFPIVVGGTGMYINCLINGISELPEVSEASREVAMHLSKENYAELCTRVYENDEKLRASITPDKHRQMIRAYEILLQTGCSIRSFFEKNKVKFLDGISYNFVLLNNIPRKELYERINKRFRDMIKNGAIDEVKSLLQKTDNCQDYPLFQAIGVREICDYLNNKCSLEEAIETACMNSRRYAKRQDTWFRRVVEGERIS